MTIGIIGIALGLIAFCAIAYACAIFALPVFAGATAGLWVYQTGAGVLGSIFTALIIGGMTLAAAQIAFAQVRRTRTRVLVAAAFVAPTVYVAYNMILTVMAFDTASDVWQHALAAMGAIIIGGTAFARLTAPTEARFETLGN